MNLTPTGREDLDHGLFKSTLLLYRIDEAIELWVWTKVEPHALGFEELAMHALHCLPAPARWHHLIAVQYARLRLPEERKFFSTPMARMWGRPSRLEEVVAPSSSFSR